MKKKVVTVIAIVLVFVGVFLIQKHQKQPDPRKKFTFWTIQLKSVYEKEINFVIDEFEKKHPDYKVEWVDIPISEAQKRTLASILSSTPPDLVNLNPDFSVLLAQKNALEFFSQDEVKQFAPSLVERLKYKGRIYALPFYATSPVVIYNKEIFNKCNVSVPKTYDELYAISPKIKACAKVSSFASNINENDTLSKILNKYGVDSLKDQTEKQSAIHVYKLFDSMYKNEFLPKDTLTLNHREVIEKYMSNQAALITAGSNFISMIKKDAPDIYKKSSISLQLRGLNSGFDVALMNLIIPSKAQNKKLALEFANMLTNRENQMKLSYATNVLPVNIEALNDNYFKNCSSDLIEQSRCIGAKQLMSLNNKSFTEENKKVINELINKTLEEILLNNSDVNKSVNDLSQVLQKLSN